MVRSLTVAFLCCSKEACSNISKHKSKIIHSVVYSLVSYKQEMQFSCKQYLPVAAAHVVMTNDLIISPACFYKKLSHFSANKLQRITFCHLVISWIVYSTYGNILSMACARIFGYAIYYYSNTTHPNITPNITVLWCLSFFIPAVELLKFAVNKSCFNARETTSFLPANCDRLL